MIQPCGKPPLKDDMEDSSGKGKTISAYFECQSSLNMFESLNSVLICLRLFLFVLKVPFLQVPFISCRLFFAICVKICS